MNHWFYKTGWASIFVRNSHRYIQVQEQKPSAQEKETTSHKHIFRHTHTSSVHLFSHARTFSPHIPLHALHTSCCNLIQAAHKFNRTKAHSWPAWSSPTPPPQPPGSTESPAPTRQESRDASLPNTGILRDSLHKSPLLCCILPPSLVCAHTHAHTCKHALFLFILTQ